jgi:hypothetical protein
MHLNLSESGAMPTSPPPQVSPAGVIAASIVWNDVDGDLVLFNAADGKYHALNEVASQLWRAIAGGMALPDIVHALHRAYRQDVEVIDAAVRDFIGQALEQGLLLPGAAEP